MRISKLPLAICVTAICAGFVAVRAEDTPEQAAARAALMEKMNELAAQPSPSNQSPPIVVTPSGAMAQPAARQTNATVAAEKAPTPASQAKTQTTSAQKMNEMNQQNWAAPASPAQSSAMIPAQSGSSLFASDAPPPKSANPNSPGKDLGLKPIAAPSPPVSAAKLAQLQALLMRYQSDQISPAEYQAERARILAEP